MPINSNQDLSLSSALPSRSTIVKQVNHCQAGQPSQSRSTKHLNHSQAGQT